MNTRARPHPLEFGNLTHEFEILARVAEPHHALDPGAVVPGTVKENDFTSRRQVFDISLKIPLSKL